MSRDRYKIARVSNLYLGSELHPSTEPTLWKRNREKKLEDKIVKKIIGV